MPAGGQAAARAASARDGGAATASDRSRRSIAAATAGSGVGGGGAGESHAIAGTDQAPGTDQVVDHGGRTGRGVLTTHRRGAADRPRDDGANGRERRLGPAVSVMASSAAAAAVSATSGASATAPSATSAPWSSSRADSVSRRSPASTASARAATRSTVCRRRDTPRAARRPAPRRRRWDPRRPSVAARTGRRARRRRARPAAGSRRPSRRAGRWRRGRSGRPPRRRRPCRGGGVPASGRAAGARSRTRTRELATTSGSAVTTRPRCSAASSTPARLSAVRPGPADGDRGAVDLQLAHAHDAVPGNDPQRRAPLEPAAPERPGHDDAATLDCEDPVDREARPVDGTPGRPRRDRVADTDEGRPQRVEPLAGDGRHRQHRDAGQRRVAEQPPHLVRSPRRPASSSTASILVTTDDAVADAQRVEQRQVLERLGARAVVGGDDEQRGIDLAGADEHVADELVVPWDVDEVELAAVVERRGARTRRRSSCRAAAPRAAGRHRCRSAPGAASSCRGRCARPCR